MPLAVLPGGTILAWSMVEHAVELEPEVRGSERRPWWALAVAVVAVGVAGLLAATSSATDQDLAHDPMPMMQVAPAGSVELASLPAEHRVLYEAAAADHEAFTHVRCYCGCEAFLDHRHLLDCFERPEGGWERHATGCAVCLAEAEEVAAQRREGVPLDEIIDHIDTKYGGMTATT